MVGEGLDVSLPNGGFFGKRSGQKYLKLTSRYEELAECERSERDVSGSQQEELVETTLSLYQHLRERGVTVLCSSMNLNIIFTIKKL